LIQLEEKVALLLAHEMHITKFQKKLQADTASINLTNADRSGNQPCLQTLIILLVILNSGSALPFETLRSGANSYGFASGSRGSGGRAVEALADLAMCNAKCSVSKIIEFCNTWTTYHCHFYIL